MAYNGSGLFIRIYSWVTDKANAVKITASRMDTEFDGIATGLSNCITKDGQTTVTANIPFNGYRLTGVGDATAATDALNRQTGDSRYSGKPVPGGRLTLTTGTPVLVASATASATIKYTPYVHDRLPFYNGTTYTSSAFTELSLAIPGVAADTNYDVFVYLSSSTPTLCYAAWTDSTTRSIALTRVEGIWLNAAEVSGAAASQRGTYVGTVRTNGSSVVPWDMGGSAAGGDAAFLYIWNAYNRVRFAVNVQDSTSDWSTSSSSWASLNGSTANRVSIVRGLDEDAIKATLACGVNSNTGTAAYIGVGLDSTTAPSGVTARSSSDPDTISLSAWYAGHPGIGLHYLQALQDFAPDDTSTGQFVGVANDNQLETLTVELMA